MIMTAVAARTTTVTRPKIMVETATATRREIVVETTAGTRPETAAESMKAISPGALTMTGAAATVAAATTATIITGDRPLLRKMISPPKKQASCDESQDARQPSPRTALPPRKSLELHWPSVHITLVTCVVFANISCLHNCLAVVATYIGQNHLIHLLGW